MKVTMTWQCMMVMIMDKRESVLGFKRRRRIPYYYPRQYSYNYYEEDEDDLEGDTARHCHDTDCP